jgi:hypothetical protein
MNEQDIRNRVNAVMVALERDKQNTPSFPTKEAQAAYHAETRAIDTAGERAVADLIVSTLSAFQRIADAMNKPDGVLFNTSTVAVAPAKLAEIEPMGKEPERPVHDAWRDKTR